MHALLQTLVVDQAEFTEWRHHMHRHPETAFEEKGTAAYIANLLRGWGYDVVEGVG